MKPGVLAMIGCLFPIGLLAGAASAEPSLAVTVDHYDIQGKTAAQLRRQMKRLGPKGFWAYTNWYVRWSGRCAVSLEVSYVYPRWTNYSSGSAALKRNWDRMLKNLKLHEEGHGQIGKDAASEIERSNCAGDPMHIIEKFVKQEKRYDAQTRHGATQGVELN